MQTVVDGCNHVAVFCGARPGAHDGYIQIAREFGYSLARRGLSLIYGVSSAGMMRAVAEGVVAGGGHVTGVIPYALYPRELARSPRGAIFLVRSIQERRELMCRLACGFAVLPGGFGTLEGLLEVTTLNQLNLLKAPVVIVNHKGFFNPMLSMIDHIANEGFISPAEQRLIRVTHTPEEAIDQLTRKAAAAMNNVNYGVS